MPRPDAGQQRVHRVGGEYADAWSLGTAQFQDTSYTVMLVATTGRAASGAIGSIGIKITDSGLEVSLPGAVRGDPAGAVVQVCVLEQAQATALLATTAVVLRGKTILGLGVAVTPDELRKLDAGHVWELALEAEAQREVTEDEAHRGRGPGEAPREDRQLAATLEGILTRLTNMEDRAAPLGAGQSRPHVPFHPPGLPSAAERGELARLRAMAGGDPLDVPFGLPIDIGGGRGAGEGPRNDEDEQDEQGLSPRTRSFLKAIRLSTRAAVRARPRGGDDDADEDLRTMAGARGLVKLEALRLADRRDPDRRYVYGMQRMRDESTMAESAPTDAAAAAGFFRETVPIGKFKTALCLLEIVVALHHAVEAEDRPRTRGLLMSAYTFLEQCAIDGAETETAFGLTLLPEIRGTAYTAVADDRAIARTVAPHTAAAFIAARKEIQAFKADRKAQRK